jgi:hypothetical protein
VAAPAVLPDEETSGDEPAAAPTVEILAPGDGSEWPAGAEIGLRGIATDTAGTNPDGPALTWTATLHHNDHVHPDFFHGEGAAETFRFEPHAPNIFYEVCLTATDAEGRAATDCVRLYQAAEAASDTTSVSAVTAGAFDEVTADGSAPGGGNQARGVRRELWRAIGGPAIVDLTAQPAFPGEPDAIDRLQSMDTSGQGKDYGERLTGYLLPPLDGEYRFWIAADDSGELWLSRDDDPANAVLIARTAQWTPMYAWDQDPAQASAPMLLAAGQRYYMEVRHKQADQKDNVAVAWQVPGGARGLIEPIYLTPD